MTVVFFKYWYLLCHLARNIDRLFRALRCAELAPEPCTKSRRQRVAAPFVRAYNTRTRTATACRAVRAEQFQRQSTVQFHFLVDEAAAAVLPAGSSSTTLYRLFRSNPCLPSRLRVVFSDACTGDCTRHAVGVFACRDVVYSYLLQLYAHSTLLQNCGCVVPLFLYCCVSMEIDISLIDTRTPAI